MMETDDFKPLMVSFKFVFPKTNLIYLLANYTYESPVFAYDVSPNSYLYYNATTNETDSTYSTTNSTDYELDTTIPTRTAPCLSTKTQLHNLKQISLLMVKLTTLVLLKTLIMAANPAVKISTGARTPLKIIPVSTAKKRKCTTADTPIASTTTTRLRRKIRGKELKIL